MDELRILKMKDGNSYNVGFSSNDYDDAEKQKLQKVYDEVFPLVVNLYAKVNGKTTTTSNALNLNLQPYDVELSWDAKIAGTEVDYSNYEGVLTYGSTTLNWGSAELSAGTYTVEDVAATTGFTLSIGGVKKTATVYMAKPMYSGSFAAGVTPTALSELTQITPIATMISSMGNQTSKALTFNYNYWIAIPDNLTINGAKDNNGNEFPIIETTEVSITGYKVYRTPDPIAANESFTFKFS